MTAKRLRIILDTNVLLSAHLWPSSIPAAAFRRAVENADLITSPELMREYVDVFSRPKFDPYASLLSRIGFLRLYDLRAKGVEVRAAVHDCIDPKDNMFLATALAGNVDLIVSGDWHLLSLHPWRGLSVLKPLDYLNLQA